jgi:uncharacterized membrane protein
VPLDLIGLLAATFLASAVEAVEAATIVVALGTTRRWRPVLQATGLAVLVLAAICVVLGPAITLLPLPLLRLIVGALLLSFGLQWLRKAILRAAGRKARNNEDLRYQRTIAGSADHAPTGSRDPYAAAVAFKSVLLEGLEIVFIVITFGANAHQVPLAAAAALAAILVIVIAAAIVRGPLSRVPENALKSVVGVMLTGFGIFWAVEGTGAHWPGDDTALPVVIGAVALLAVASIAVLRRRPAPERPAPVPHHAARPSRVHAVLLFVYDYIVGDDWVVAVAIVLGIALEFAAVVAALPLAWVPLPFAVLASMPIGLRRAQR